MAEDIPHGPPVTQDLYASHRRIFPNIVITKAGVFPLLAPTEGFVESIIKDKGQIAAVIFRHKKEPYYSMLEGGKDTEITLQIGQEVLRGVLMGSTYNQINWRIGSMGNTKDWMDPDDWLKGNYTVWTTAVDPNKPFKKKTDWGTIALYLGGAYLVLKGNK